MLNRNSGDNETNAQKFFFWTVYFGAAAVAAYHSAVVFLMSDPWFVAVPAALVVDGLTAYSMSVLGRWKNDQKAAGFIGILLFAFVSASAQIISRFSGMGVETPAALRWISLALVPLSSTGAVIVLGAIKYFGNSKPVSENSVQYAPPMLSVKPVTTDDLKQLTEASRAVDAQLEKMIETAPEGESDSIFAPIQELVKRGRGRPKKVSYAKDVEENPKL